MSLSSFPAVIGKEGALLGRLEEAADSISATEEATTIRLEDGRLLRIPKGILRRQPDGGYFLPLDLAEIERQNMASGASEANSLTIPIVAEELQVRTRTVETGRVQVRKTVQEHEEIVDEPLLRETVSVERVTLNQIWEGPAPGVREEGDTLVIPVLEEVLVVEKRLMLKEELRVRRERSTFHEPQRVVLRSEEVRVERLPASEVSPADPLSPA